MNSDRNIGHRWGWGLAPPLCYRQPVFSTRLRFTLLPLAVATVLAASPFDLAAQGPGAPADEDNLSTDGRVAVNRLDVAFAEALTFHLEVETEVEAQVETAVDAEDESAVEAEVASAVLYYTVGSDGPRNRRRPVVRPAAGGTQTLTHRESIARGQIPPSALVRWWWELELDDGARIATEPQTERYLDHTLDWQREDHGSVTVWWHWDDPNIGDEVAGLANQSLASVADLIGAWPDRQIHIVAYRSEAAMRRALVDRGDVYEARLTTLGARVDSDIVMVLVTDELPAILAHELAHIGLHLRFEDPFAPAPLWLDEGLAMWAEGPLGRDDETILADALADDDVFSFRSLTTFPGRAEDVPIAYVQSYDIVDFLIDTYGEAAIAELVSVIGRAEVPLDAATEAAFGADQDALYQAYRQARGLGPAVTPEPPPADAEAPGSPGPCAAAALPLLIALPVAWHRRAHQFFRASSSA